MQRQSLPLWILTAGLVFVFGYFGIDKFVHPEIWIGWIPPWMEGFVGLPRETWLSIIGFSEASLAILLLIPVRIVQKIGALLIVLHLIGILTQVGWNDIAVRDIGLLFMGIALFMLL
jgi:uncharacterized membrane protein